MYMIYRFRDTESVCIRALSVFGYFPLVKKIIRNLISICVGYSNSANININHIRRYWNILN